MVIPSTAPINVPAKTYLVQPDFISCGRNRAKNRDTRVGSEPRAATPLKMRGTSHRGCCILPVRRGDIDLNLYDRIEPIYPPWACRFRHRPSRGSDRGLVPCRRERLPRTAARSDGGRGGDARRNAPVRGHALEPAFVWFRDPVPGERQRPGHPSAAAATAPTAGATIATESDPAAGGQGGPSAASAGTGSDRGRAGTRREDRARKAGPIVRAATCCISADGTETRTAQHSRRGRTIRD